MYRRYNLILIIVILIGLNGCAGNHKAGNLQQSHRSVGHVDDVAYTDLGNGKRLEFADSQSVRRLEVTASAYNSLAGQTDSTPSIAAWGDRLKPGMKAIAVSRDLLDMGLTRNSEVTIKGLTGKYLVLDKMNKRWSRKIDIYMGHDRTKALEWGRRKVEISWAE